jgi:hypothetical protein
VSATVVESAATAAKPVDDNYGVDPSIFMQRYEQAAAQRAKRSDWDDNASPVEDQKAMTILGQLEEAPDGLTVKQLTAATRFRPTTIMSALQRLRVDGQVTGGGRHHPWKATGA